MTRTTPPRPVDVAAVFPQLALLARTAIRLHPYPGSPSPHDSSIGGPLLWPAAEPWPYCDGPHEPDGVNPATSLEDVRLDRRIRVAALRRPHRDPYYPEYTPEELAIENRIRVGCPWPVGPLAMLPVAQLYLRDIPVLRPPGPADVLQVLWCPFEHPSYHQPETALFWRSAAAVTDILTTPPEPTAVQNSGSGVPEPCLLDPEQVTEYPNHMELSEDLQELVGQWSARRADGAVPDNLDAVDLAGLYWADLSLAPGWKVGGWPHWGLTDPSPQFCPACNTEMAPLLTIASTEWDASTCSWIPNEVQADAEPSAACLDPRNPAMVTVSRGYTLQLYACPASPDHPHTDRIQ